jgi:NAD(P)-dependent dehydrogenase (short-subunit alcohol dehydrogenase family)
VINCLASVEAAGEVAEEIRGPGQPAMVIRADMASKSEVDTMVKRMVNEFGKIDN